MDSLRSNNPGKIEPEKNVVNLRNVKNNLPNNLSSRQNIPAVHPATPISKNEPVRQNQSYNDAIIKEKSTKRIRLASSVALFLMVIGFAVAIGWYEFKNNDNNLEKLLSKNTPTDKAESLDVKTSATNSDSAAPAKTAQAQQAAAQQNQTLPADSENLNTGVTNPDAASDSASGEKKTYKSDAEGISFDYPAEYKIEENNGQIVANKNDTMWRMKIYDNKDKQEIKEWVNSYFSGKDVSDCNESDSTTLKIGVLTTKIMKDGDASGKCEGAGYYALNSDKSKIARVRLDKADETEANKILSTFKFIK